MFTGLETIIDGKLAMAIGGIVGNAFRFFVTPLGFSIGGHNIVGLDLLLGILFANMGIWFIHHFFLKNGD